MKFSQLGSLFHLSLVLLGDTQHHDQFVFYFTQEIQQSLEVGHPLRAYLITPVQRITRYQLLLKEILKYTTRADKDSTCVQVTFKEFC